MENSLKEIKNEYQNLKNKLDDIAINKFGMDENGGFPSSSKFKSYVNQNKTELEKLKSLREQIEQLEYELMSPKVREEYDEYRRLSKLKADGKLEL